MKGLEIKLESILAPFPAARALQACMEAPAFEYNGLRKIVQSVGFSIDAFPDIRWSEFGYTKAKEKALFRMYYNEAEAARIKSLLVKRKGQGFSAIDMSTRAGAKDARSMGHCLSSLQMAMADTRKTLEVIYRSTEVIKKHSADLWFLPRVLEKIGYQPTSIRFYFANAYISGVFLPVLFNWINPIDFFEYLRKHDPAFFKFGSRFIRRSTRKENQVFPYSPEQHQHIYLWRTMPRELIKIMRDYLEAYQ